MPPNFLWKRILRLVAFWAFFGIAIMPPQLPLEVDFETRRILGVFQDCPNAPQLPLEVDFETRLILGVF